MNCFEVYHYAKNIEVSNTIIDSVYEDPDTGEIVYEDDVIQFRMRESETTVTSTAYMMCTTIFDYNNADKFLPHEAVIAYLAEHHSQYGKYEALLDLCKIIAVVIENELSLHTVKEAYELAVNEHIPDDSRESFDYTEIFTPYCQELAGINYYIINR